MPTRVVECLPWGSFHFCLIYYIEPWHTKEAKGGQRATQAPTPRQIPRRPQPPIMAEFCLSFLLKLELFCSRKSKGGSDYFYS